MTKRPLHFARAFACLFLAWGVVAHATTVSLPMPDAQPKAQADAHSTAVAPAHGSLDSEPIRHTGDGGNSTAPNAIRPVSLELPRVAGALALVIGLIVTLRWVAKKYFVSPTTKASTRAVQVLSRSAIAPRQHILLLRVGRRVIVVGDSAAKMSPLSEITDADEVAALLGQLQDEKTPLPNRAFSAFFSRARDDMDQETDAVEEGQISPSIDADEEQESDDQAAVTSRREELTGLMDKIRVLSKHFRTDT